MSGRYSGHTPMPTYSLAIRVDPAEWSLAPADAAVQADADEYRRGCEPKIDHETLQPRSWDSWRCSSKRC